MAIQTAAGASIAIATTSGVATVDQAGFAAKTYVVIGETTDIPQFGDEYAEVTHSPLDKRRVQKLKGSVNAGNTSINYARDTADAGQAKLLDALSGTDKDKNWAFKVTFQDGSIRYFLAQVMSVNETIGSINDVVKGSTNLGINSAFVFA